MRCGHWGNALAKSYRTVLAALLISTALPSLTAAQSIGDPTDPATWRTPEFMAQWGLYWIGADFAYAKGLDGTGVKVGVVDTGLDVDHPEFAGRYAEGITFNPEMPWNADKNGHGTAVASVIAANRDGNGMHGVAPGATIVMANHDTGGVFIDLEAATHGIHTLIRQGVRIINNSYGGYPVTSTTAGEFENDAPDYLATSRYAVSSGALLIFGTGNEGATQPADLAGLPYLFPELERGWLAVAATGPNYMPGYSNRCGVAMNWCLVAPGGGPGWEWDPNINDYVWRGLEDGILVAKPGGDYEKTLGTSFAAPHVSGAAALVAQAFPYMTMDQVRQVLLGTAWDVGAPGVDPVFGYGLLDVGKAVRGPGKFDWGDFVADVPSGRSTWENDITGNGGLVKAGYGALILTGDSSYRGDTRIAQGVLAVDGSIRSDTLIEPEGVLSGGGTVHGDVLNDGAVYGGLGSQGGTLTIDGNYTQSPDAGLMVMVGAPQGTSRVDVTGSANVSGWVDALVPMGGYRGDARYTVLTALGGISGRFEDDCGCYAFLDLKLSYDPTAVHLDVARNTVAFADRAASRNGAAVAAAVEKLGIGQPFYDLAVTLSGDDAADLFGQLPGEVHGSTVTGLIENSQLIGTQMNDRLRSAFETVGAQPPPMLAYDDDAKDITTASVRTAERHSAWGSAFGSWGSTDSDGNAGKLSRSAGGFVTGVDGLVGNGGQLGDWRLGFLTGYSHSSLKIDDRKSSASSENYHLGVYGGTQWGALSFRSGLTHTWSRIESGRQLALGDFAGSESSDYRAGTTQLFGELGYGMKAGSVALEPFANLAYVNVHASGFTEQGEAALTVHGGSNAVTFSTLGLRASTDFDVGTMKATARGTIGWRHGYGDVTPTVSQALAGSDAFTVAGAPIARDAAVLEAGLDFAIAPAASLGVSYQGQIGTQSRDHGFRADLSVRF
ncbi:autotransporter domain-containing protein [Mesorhizobium sp. NPDC059054]|uniref:autotransporter domain-containing protein n=1 Tax=Mesorhizobium sp. NPDC059054 TaxID=3346711 RepID=UPI00367EFE01